MQEDGRVSISGVSKSFGSVRALKDVGLVIGGGEFFTLLGPSGSGKTSLLRVIGGFVRPDRGTVVIEDQDVTGWPPERRPTAMVFQSYALFPHLSVFENVAFGLRVRRLPAAEIQKRVAEALKLVKMESFTNRPAPQLSGGQQQRVAVARAIVIKPKILLLDEPLSALDAQLREEMQVELRNLQRVLGITAISVTHDQNEALGMSDRVAVMRNGRVEQVGRPEELYGSPASDYVASFIGKAALVSVERVDGDHFYLRGLETPLPMARIKTVDLPSGGKAAVLRPEMLSLVDGKAAPPCTGAALNGRIAAIRFIGSSYVIDVRLDCGVKATVNATLLAKRFTVDETVKLLIRSEYLS